MVAAGDVPGPTEILDVLPVVVVLAAVNALNEEVAFRSAPLATLTPTVGTGHAMALNAVLFGIVHYSGIPYGLPGVAMAAVSPCGCRRRCWRPTASAGRGRSTSSRTSAS
ncbi:MAG: CPBP family intramembrane glutamic endopeptidase [Acidimicrobiia bacterium]